MSEHITHVAVFEDAARLLSARPSDFPPEFQAAISQHYDYGIVACSTRGNRQFAVPIIKKYKSQSLDDRASAELCGALGWISHRAADAQLNYLADTVDAENNPYYTGQDLKLYYDAVVKHNVYDSGRRSTLSRNEFIDGSTLATNMSASPAARHFETAALERLWTNGMMREFIQLHHFYQAQPTTDDLVKYVETFDTRAQYYGENLPLYERAFENPDPVIMQAVNYRINFYDPDDQIIRLVRAIQLGDQPEQSVEMALQGAETQSHYARTLKLNYEYWMAAGRFFKDQISEEVLEHALNKRYS